MSIFGYLANPVAGPLMQVELMNRRTQTLISLNSMTVCISERSAREISVALKVQKVCQTSKCDKIVLYRQNCTVSARCTTEHSMVSCCRCTIASTEGLSDIEVR